MQLSVAHDFLPKANTVRASRVMDHFGIGFEHGQHVIAHELELPIQPGQVVLFTGPSGSGKSSLMRAAAAHLSGVAGVGTSAASETPGSPCASILSIEDLPLNDALLIDALPIDALEAMQLLAQCGLGEARLLLRRPAELSDGQRYRFRLALGLAHKPDWLVADEFTATLDRTLAKVIAFNIRRLADRTGSGFLLATTHEDIVDDLAPDVHVRCSLDGTINVQTKPTDCVGENPACRKKKASALSTRCGSAARPVATGRTSLGGITAATSWP